MPHTLQRTLLSACCGGRASTLALLPRWSGSECAGGRDGPSNETAGLQARFLALDTAAIFYFCQRNKQANVGAQPLQSSQRHAVGLAERCGSSCSGRRLAPFRRYRPPPLPPPSCSIQAAQDPTPLGSARKRTFPPRGCPGCAPGQTPGPGSGCGSAAAAAVKWNAGRAGQHGGSHVEYLSAEPQRLHQAQPQPAARPHPRLVPRPSCLEALALGRRLDRDPPALLEQQEQDAVAALQGRDRGPEDSTTLVFCWAPAW